jgi:hypothetical protein
MYLYGVSGHAKVIIDIIRTQGGVVEGLVNDNPKLEGLCDIRCCTMLSDYLLL